MAVHHVSSCHGRPNGKWKNSKQSKKSEKLKITQKFIVHFVRHPSLYHGVSYVKKNSGASLIKCPKGYSVIFTYDWEISKQSWDTNRETPCRMRCQIAASASHRIIINFLLCHCKQLKWICLIYSIINQYVQRLFVLLIASWEHHDPDLILINAALLLTLPIEIYLY